MKEYSLQDMINRVNRLIEAFSPNQVKLVRVSEHLYIKVLSSPDCQKIYKENGEIVFLLFNIPISLDKDLGNPKDPINCEHVDVDFYPRR